MDVNAKLTESVIKSIMEGTDPRSAIDAALDEKAGYHKEKRIRGGKPEIVQVKNVKRKKHHTLTADQRKAIKKAHSAAANKKRAKSLKKGNKMGLYKESVELVSEADEEVTGLTITCPECGNAALEIFDDPETDNEGIILVCPECGETFVVVNSKEWEDEEDDEDEEEKEEEKAEEEAPQDEAKETCDDGACDPEPEVAPAVEAPVAEEAVAEEAPVAEEAAPAVEEAPACEPEQESGLFFAAE